ncbi:YigZ family protein [Alicyclobacillus macrosporangiidus]|uniref:Uncharacterized protein, YigZ family n=1 Tax=Alicyclobacillus macrosporangiidus TaxID=392015 RepID=A0A1I7HZ56_9BACL|nr:YigZ family protein [Alicyclobacillus macrosporangiidus]SFU65993.1 uncharacterized protein, YigZ family [Alicyclobacillus macrosporangiidus]
MSTVSGEFIMPEAACQAELVIKKSRFIGHLVPARAVEEAEAALAAIRTEHKTATHNCYAYRVGTGVPVERFSDDGEPSGTAGRPILEVLRRKPVTNALVVVTRYFGGVLLGANGLVRAYADTTSHVIDHAVLLHCRPLCKLDVVCDYGQYGRLEHALTQAGRTLVDRVFTETVSFSLWVPAEEAEAVADHIVDTSHGQAQVTRHTAQYAGVRPDGSLVFDVLPEDAS